MMRAYNPYNLLYAIPSYYFIKGEPRGLFKLIRHTFIKYIGIL